MFWRSCTIHGLKALRLRAAADELLRGVVRDGAVLAPDSAPLYLLGHALSSAYLHREVREKGGAYGGGASAAPVEGVFAMSSYRDPNVLKTIETFKNAAEWAATRG